MPLNNLIAGSYGDQDGQFAGHDLDIDSAREALMAAKDEGVGFTEYIERHRQYLEGRNFPEPHIQQQLERVKDLKNYFNLD